MVSAGNSKAFNTMAFKALLAAPLLTSLAFSEKRFGSFSLARSWQISSESTLFSKVKVLLIEVAYPQQGKGQ